MILGIYPLVWSDGTKAFDVVIGGSDAYAFVGQGKKRSFFRWYVNTANKPTGNYKYIANIMSPSEYKLLQLIGESYHA